VNDQDFGLRFQLRRFSICESQNDRIGMTFWYLGRALSTCADFVRGYK
jgi:hypothetical protein